MAEGGRNLQIRPFTVEDDHIATGEKWEEWLEDLEREMRFFRISEPEDKKDAMLIYGGAEIRRLEKSLQDPTEGDIYSKLRGKLNNYYAPKKNEHYARYLFLKMKPHHGESTIAYAARLREKAADCNFHSKDERILEHIIQTTENAELVRKVLHKKWTLEQTLAEMQLLEDTSTQVNAMAHHDTDGVAKISKKNKGKNKSSQYERCGDINCKYCDRTHPRKKELCPAYGKSCDICGKRNHFASVCMSDKKRRRTRLQRGQASSSRDVRRAAHDSESEDSNSDFEQELDFIDESVRHLTVGKIKINKVSDFEKTVPIVVNDVIVHMEPDSGADVNVMDEFQYRALKRKSYDEIALTESKTKLSTLQNELGISGEFKATARNQTRGAETTFVVVRGKINSPPLLGRKTLFELGMLEIRPDGTLKEPNELRIQYKKSVRSILNQWPRNPDRSRTISKNRCATG